MRTRSPVALALPALLLVGAAITFLALAPHGPAPAQAGPGETPTLYVSGDPYTLVFWRPVGEAAWVVTFELGYADPRIGRGPIPARGVDQVEPGDPEAPAGLFRTDPADAPPDFTLGGAPIVPVGGVRWDAANSTFVTGDAGLLTTWSFEGGDIRLARLHHYDIVPPHLDPITRQTADGQGTEEIVVGLPPRNVGHVEVFPRAPSGRLLGWTVGDVAPVDDD